MGTVLIAVGAFAAYIVAYHTYGKFISRKLFGLDAARTTPACELNDGVDYVPTKAEVLFGHHFTSIAGTGPIVGPAIAVIWGWVPALIWVLLGSVFMGAVHDFSALVISARHQGRSIGDIAGDLINGRVRFLFLSVIFLALLIVVAIFCLVIAVLFARYPQAVFPVWIEIPIALLVGYLVYRKSANSLMASLAGVAVLYLAIVAGAFFPLEMPTLILGAAGADQTVLWAGAAAVKEMTAAAGVARAEELEASLVLNPTILWSVLLLIYAFAASVLPVWRLLQPRDYINGHKLFITLGLLALGVLVARPEIVAPYYQPEPTGAPPLWPMLFVTIACGAISGFHCLVGSGTTSKQLSNERHALPIGYGGMLLEGLLAVFVIIAVAAGIGMGQAHLARGGAALPGAEIWNDHYASWQAAKSLPQKVGAFVDGSANMLTALGIPLNIGLALMGVFVASFAATTLDTATRLQRYVVAELAASVKLKPLTNKYAATTFAVVTAAILAFQDYGAGGMILWPLFGATNQLLACLALLVATVYLKRKGKPLAFTLIPMSIMLVVTGWAMLYNIQVFRAEGNQLLMTICAITVVLEAWMVIESFIVMRQIEGPGPQTS